MKTTNEKLRALIKKKSVSRKEIVDILGVSLPTIRSWLSPPGSKNFRNMREPYLTVLRRSIMYRRKKLSKDISIDISQDTQQTTEESRSSVLHHDDHE